MTATAPVSELTVVQLDLPEPPSANRWYRYSRQGHGHLYLAPDALAYKETVWLLLHRNPAVRRTWQPGLDPKHSRALWMAEAVSLTVRWFRSRRSGDLDKRLGVLLDALQGILYASDKQVVEIHAYRHEATGPASVVVTAQVVDPDALLKASDAG